ncbi:hypothetical protein RJT34_33002 [Clitoria ternatea]|uniref:BHLH domain-containing protein n=1 Tax=Clitoria ternatea TaxID=43366 RepID=A0AAN9F522_CLITE
MDGVFALPETARTDFLGSLVQSLGCAYVCLWRYDSNCVPGVAFRNQFPYLELQHLDLLRLASTQTQTRFFQEAGIKTVVYMGCSKGEIELGFSNMPQVDIHAILRNLFPGDFCIESQSIDQTHPTPSSSSFISLSASSPECSSLLFSTINPLITSSPLFPPETLPTHQQTIPSHYLRTPEGEHDAIIRALLHVISPPSSSTTTTSQQQQHHQNLPHSSGASTTAHAFKSYTSDNITAPIGSNFPRQSMLNRSVVFLRSLNFMRARERNINEAPRATTSAHLYHMISERRRRVKLNESFQALRALLPPGTKGSEWDECTFQEAVRRVVADLLQWQPHQ